MEYVSHIWGGSTHTVLLEKVESRVFHLNSPVLIRSSLSARRIVASVSLYAIAITIDIALLNSLIAYLLLWEELMRHLSTWSHPFSVQCSDPRLNRHAQSYLYSSGKVWYTLPLSIFQTWFTYLQMQCIRTCQPLIVPYLINNLFEIN